MKEDNRSPIQKVFAIGILLLFFSTVSFSQNTVVKGLVSDQSNIPIVGATIKGKTSNVSTTTNSEGAFTLNVPATEVLIISYIGFRQQEVPVDGKAMLQVTLTEES